MAPALAQQCFWGPWWGERGTTFLADTGWLLPEAQAALAGQAPALGAGTAGRAPQGELHRGHCMPNRSRARKVTGNG